MVSGVGYARAAAAGRGATRFHDIRRVVSNLGVFDFETPERTMRLRSHHPGVTVEDIVAATGFALTIPDDVAETRLPTPEELDLIRNVLDPGSLARPRGAELTADARDRRSAGDRCTPPSTPSCANGSACATRWCRPAWAGSPGPAWSPPRARRAAWASWPRPP